MVGLRMTILGFCLLVITAILILPDVDLLDAAGTEVFAAVTVKVRFGAPPSVKLERAALAKCEEKSSTPHADVLELPSPVLVSERRSSPDFLCLLRC